MNFLMRTVCTLIYRSIGTKLPFSFWPGGRVFSEARRWLLIGMGCEIGPGCDIEPRIDVGLGPRLKIGRCCQINQDVIIRTAQLGNYVMLAPGVVMLDRQHNFASVDVPMALQGSTDRVTTMIGDDVWVGQNSIIMPGVAVGTGAVIAAGAVVTHDIEPYQIVAGVPARPIRDRRKNSAHDDA